jgi:hypothetical protein
MKFACPSCQQHIEADDGYAGMQIACPMCKAQMIVPGTPASPAPPPTSAPPSYGSHPQSSLRTHAQAQAPAAAGGGCPQCGAPMSRGAVLCTKCGFNSATGQSLSPQATAARRGFTAGGSDKWYANPYLYLGVIALAFIGLFAMAMGDNQAMKIALVGSVVVYVLVIYVWTAVVAFKEGVGQGIGCLICGLYATYFVFKEDTSPVLKAFVGLEIAVAIGLKFTILASN